MDRCVLLRYAIRYAMHYDILCIILACIILLRIIWECIISICIHEHMDLIGTGKNRDKNGILSRDRMQNRCDELITSKVTKKNALTKEDINSIGNRITSIHSSNSFKAASKCLTLHKQIHFFHVFNYKHGNAYISRSNAHIEFFLNIYEKFA